MSETKSDFWLIPERIVRYNEVVFNKKLTMSEALLAYAEGDFEDVIDFEDKSEEVWDTADPIGDDIEYGDED